MEDFKNRVNETKKKINEAKLSKEFKDNLKIIMDKEYYKTTNENSKVRLVENKNSAFKNTKLKLLYHKKIVAIFLCFIIISSLTFAGDWENFFAKIFYNMDESMSLAIEEGYIQNIDMDYVECNGIKIKVDYILFDEQRLYIAFNVNTEKEFDDLYLNNFTIRDDNNNLMFDCENNYIDILFKTERKKIDSNSIILLSKFENINTVFNDIKKIQININSIEINSPEQSSLVKGNWNFEIEVEKIDNDYNIEKVDAYFENSEELIKEYDIKVEHSKLKVELLINGIETDNVDLSKSNMYLEDMYGNKYYADDNLELYKNKLMFSIRLPKDIELYSSKLKVKYSKNQKDELMLYLKKNING